MTEMDQRLIKTNGCQHPGVFARSESWYTEHPEHPSYEGTPCEFCSMCGRWVPISNL